MLIKQAQLEKIRIGQISLIFRKWKKKIINKGTLLKTSIGQVEILDIKEISSTEISVKDTHEAGYEKLSDLLETLNSYPGKLFKIGVRYHSQDPRIILRNKSTLDKVEFDQIKLKLQRLDKYSKHGDWTILVLHAILENPKLKSGDLAFIVDKERVWLKTNIRKLKNVGLTISHEVGYSISPLGKIFLEKYRSSDY